MIELCLLVGFCRHIPDVYTFVTPVFLSNDNMHVAQYDKEEIGLVTAFRPIATDVGFERTSLELGTKCGNPILFGFEISKTVVIGHAPLLAQYLQENFLPLKEYQSQFPKTVDAVKRFIHFASSIANKPTASYLFELRYVDSQAEYLPMSMFTLWNSAHWLLDNITQMQWENAILNALTCHHNNLSAHQSAKSSLMELAHKALDPAQALADLVEALANVLKNSLVLNNELRACNDKSICSACLFDLIVDNPSPAGLSGIVAFVANLRLASLKYSHETTIYFDALHAVQSFFVHNEKHAEFSGAYTCHIAFLNDLENDFFHPLAEQASDMLAELGEEANTNKYLERMQCWNRNFDQMVQSATNRIH